MTWAGATTGDFGDTVTLAADGRDSGTTAPVPYRPVTLTRAPRATRPPATWPAGLAAR